MKKKLKKKSMTKDAKQKVYMAFVYLALLATVIWTVSSN